MAKKAAPMKKDMPMHDMGMGKMMPGKKHMMPDMPPKGMPMKGGKKGK